MTSWSMRFNTLKIISNMNFISNITKYIHTIYIYTYTNTNTYTYIYICMI